METGFQRPEQYQPPLYRFVANSRRRHVLPILTDADSPLAPDAIAGGR